MGMGLWVWVWDYGYGTMGMGMGMGLWGMGIYLSFPPLLQLSQTDRELASLMTSTIITALCNQLEAINTYFRVK